MSIIGVITTLGDAIIMVLIRYPFPIMREIKFCRKKPAIADIIPILLNAENFVLTTGTFAIPDNTPLGLERTKKGVENVSTPFFA